MVIVLVIGAAVAGPVPTWWSATMASLTGISAVWMTLNWRRTRAMLAIGIGLFLVWTAGTLM
jgi:divalent metal cation (Fe/Co/Zn/Cd) transporter